MMNQQHVIYRSSANSNSNSTAANRVKSAASGYSRFNRNSYGDSEVITTIILFTHRLSLSELLHHLKQTTHE